jgi:hypothetical protein
VNAIFVPSGDQAGSESRLSTFVRFDSSEPFAFMT